MYLHHKNIIRNKGFSLIELGLVLMILSVILGAGLTFFVEQKKSDRFEETNTRMDEIEKAIARFVLANGRIPCPANVNAVFNDADIGQEEITSAAGMDTCENGNYGDTGDSVSAGMVPVQDLGLSREYMLDGWNKKIMYVVDERFANSEITNENCQSGANINCFRFQGSCRADISDATCETLLPADHIEIWSTIENVAVGLVKSRGVAYVLISFGENGSGAYQYNGQTREANPTGIDELKNADDFGFDPVFVSRSRTENFDDIVRYKTKHQILDSLGSMPSESICLMAENVINSNIADGQENHACANTTATAPYGSNCLSYATAIDSLCLGYYETIVAP